MFDTISEIEIAAGRKALVTGWDPEVCPNIILERGVGVGVTQYGRMGNTLKIKPPLVITDK